MAWGSCYTPDFRVASIIGASTGTTALNDRRLVENITGSPTFQLDGVDTGRYSMRIVNPASEVSIALASLTAAQPQGGLMFRFKVAALNTTFIMCGFTGSSVGSSVFIRVVASTGVVQYSLDNASTWVNAGSATVVAGQTHRIEVYVDLTTASAHIIKIRFDGTEVTNTTGGPAVTSNITGTGIRVGILAAAASTTVDFSDMAVYSSSAEYGTMDDWRVFGVEPTSDGTHATSADFQNQASSSLSGTTTSWQLVDDAPTAAPSTTDFVKQTTSATGAYLEWVLDVVPSGYGDPEMVCLAAALHPVASATSTNNAQFRLNAGGNVSSETAIDQSITADTIEYRKHHYATRPGGAAWVISDVNATTPLRARWGHSTDIVPVPACDAIMAFVLVPAISNQTVSPPAATASASAPVPVPSLGVPPATATASASSPIPRAYGNVKFDSATDGGSLTFSHTCSGIDRYLTVGVAIAGTTVSVTGITYNGVAMGLIKRSVGSGSASELWGLINPASGAHNVVITLSGAAGSAEGAVSFSDTNQSTQNGASGATFGTGTTVTSASISGAPGGMLVDVVGAFSAVTIQTGTQAWNDGSGDGQAYLLATGSPQTISWTLTSAQWSDAIGVVLPIVFATNQTVSPPAATASSSSLVPTPQLSIPAPVASASASSLVPVPQLRLLPPAATANASAPTPVPGDGITVPLATASANGPPSVPQLSVPPAAATASASAPVPTVTVPGAASFVADLFTPVPNVTSSTTMTATTAVTVAAGDSAIIQAGARGGTSTAQSCSLSGLPGDAVVEKSPDISASGSPAVQMFRVYFPTGMASGTVITFTWTQSATRKAASGQVITNLANANGLWQTATPGATANLTAGTTAATTTTTGWHTAAWWYQSATGTFTVTLGSDAEGAMTERADLVVGASSFGYIYVEDRAVTAAHSGGETATATISSAAASSVGVQGVWSGSSGVADQTVSPPAATSDASAPVPIPDLKVSPAAATANASAPIPVPQDRVPPGAATASASALTPVPQLRVNIPTKGAIVLGYSNQLLTGTQAQDAERLMGRTFRGLRQNQNITNSGWSTAVTEYSLGRRLTYRSVDLTSGTWSDVTAGTHDTELLAIASNLVATGLWSPSNPAYICFMHEASISSNSVYGTGQDYINAYRHVVDLWDANGYTAVKKDGTANGGPIVMVLVHFLRAFTNTLELGGTETPPAGLAHADFDPDGGSSPAPGGTTYYSGIGIDAYNSITSAGHLKYGTTASNLLDGVFTQAHNTGKFTFIGEFGCEDGTTTTDHQNKADWLDSVRVYLSSKVGTVEQTRALLLTIKSSAENYNVDSSQQSIDAFKRLGLHSDFFPEYATGFGSNPTLPINVPTATASASAPVPTVSTNQIVSPPASTANASAPISVPQLRVSPAAATANASAPVPTVQAGVSPAAATASASSLTPTAQLKVLPGAATASASSLIPTVGTNPVVSPPAGASSASSPTPSVKAIVLPPPISPIRFSRVNHGGYCTDVPGGAAAEGTRYAIMCLNGAGAGDQSQIATLKSRNADLKVFRYSDPLVTDSANPNDLNNTITYTYADANHPEWFVKDQSNNRVQAGWATNFVMDLGSASYQEYAADLLISTLASEGSWDGVYFDEINAHTGWFVTGAGQVMTTPDYSTDAKWSAAVTSFLAYMRTRLLSAGYKMTINIGVASGDETITSTWASSCDGLFFEGYGHDSAGNPRTYELDADWLFFQDQVTALEAAGKFAWCRTYRNTDVGHRYGLASLLLVTGVNSTWDAEWTSGNPFGGSYSCTGIGGPKWLPDYDYARRLGNPTGAYFTASSGVTLYRRDFERGSVIVNPHTSDATSYSLGGTYSGSGYSHVTAITLTANTAAILTLDSADIQSASASALTPTVGTNPVVSPPVATATASAPVPAVQLKVSPAAATANASAPVPTVSANSTVAPPAATANASAPIPTAQLRVSPAAATANASAPIPVVTGGQVVSSPSGTASASAPTPVPQINVSPAASTASASGPIPTVAAGQTIAPPAGTASASAPTPTIQLRLLPPATTVNASGLVPSPQVGPAPSVTVANASAPAPTLQIRAPIPAAATASASALTPTPGTGPVPPAATANASALTPTIQIKILPPAATANAVTTLPTVGGNQSYTPPVAVANGSAPTPTVGAASTVTVPVATASASAPKPHVMVKQWPPHGGSQWPEHDYTQWPEIDNSEQW